MSKLAFLFPGQGAQYPGMGQDIANNFTLARETFQEADEVLGFKLSDIIINGPEEKLMQTEMTQPAILTVSIAVMRVLKEVYGVYPGGGAGLSLGEYTALVTADSIKFSEALPLVKKRGKYMQEAVPLGQGKMVAVIGLETKKVEEICQQVREKNDKVVNPVNYNCPGQVVVAGETSVVDKVSSMCEEENARKVIELPVSAPFHCEMLEPASKKLDEELKHIEIKEPGIKVLSNVTGEPMKDPGEIKRLLKEQVKSPVLWEQSMRNFLEKGYNYFVELPPGKTLTSFMRKIERKKVKCKTVESSEKIEKVKKELTEEGIICD